MKRQAGTNAALAAALCGVLPNLQKANLFLFSLTLLSIVMLLLSALILVFHERYSSPTWKWLVARASALEVEFSFAGLGLVTTGLNLIRPSWIWVGIVFFLVGGVLIGFGIAKPLTMVGKLFISRRGFLPRGDVVKRGEKVRENFIERSWLNLRLGWNWVWEECKWEIKNVKNSENPGLVLPGLKYLFAALYLFSAGGWINRKYRKFTSREIREMGFLFIYRRVDIYIIVWIVFELLALLYIFRSPTVIQSSLSCFALGFFSYRLFEIFQSWLSQFVLHYKWDPINANRSLVLAFEGYSEVIVIGAVIRLATYQQLDGLRDALYSSVVTMIANPLKEDASPIQYAQIMFAVLFAAVVVQQVVGRLTNKEEHFR